MHPSFKTVAALIRKHKNFLLTTHVNPDGDGLGSELALGRFLRKLGKNAVVVNHSKTPANYEFLSANNELGHFAPARDRETILQADVIFILDTNRLDRLRSMEPFVRESKATKVVIDHHLDADNFADHCLVDEDATSTGEIVYRLLLSIDPAAIDKDIATALYAAIMTDTGSFRYPRTDPEVHVFTAQLLERGVDPSEIFSNIYENWSAGRMRLLGTALATMRTVYDGRFAYMVCTQKMLAETGTSVEETDNFTTFPMSVKGVVAGMLINELPNGVKISLRSKGEIPINKLANEFGGGGHKNAAGARLHDMALQDAINLVIEKAGKYVQSEQE